MQCTLYDVYALAKQMKPAAGHTNVTPPAEQAAASPVVAVSTQDLLRWLCDSQEGQRTGPLAAAEPSAQQCSPPPAAGQSSVAPAHRWQPSGVAASPAVSPATHCVRAAAAGNAHLARQKTSPATQTPQQAASVGSVLITPQTPLLSSPSSEIRPLLPPRRVRSSIAAVASMRMACSTLC